MTEDMKAWQVRHAAHDVLWHVRLAATALGHSSGPWGSVAAIVPNSAGEVQKERARCMNIISAACGRFISVLHILNGREERYDPDAVFEELIEYCDIAMADLKVSRLRQVLEDAGRVTNTARREPRA
jgi:hypothetical protein